MNLKETFDDDYASRMKELLIPLYDFLETQSPKTEEEAYQLIESLDKENQVSKEEAAFIVLFMLRIGAEELNNQFQAEYLASHDKAPEEESTVKAVWKEWAVNNIAMIMTIPTLYKKYTALKLKTIINNFKESDAYLDIQEEVNKRILQFIKEASLEGKEASSARINFWARDQTGNLVHDTTKSLFIENGLETYLYVTKNDGLVRPKHQPFHNVVRKWGESPEPGEDPGCRCEARVP